MRGSQRNQCQRNHGSSQNSQNFPTPNSQCYQQDVNHKTSSPNGCQQFLKCESNNCKWREYQCSQSQYWNNAQKKCVQSHQQATCGAAIFGRQAKVHIQNTKYGKVLDDSREGQQGNSWQAQSNVIGFEKKPEGTWNQVLVVKRRGDDEFYSLAFDKKEDGQVKVIADSGNNKPVAKLYNPSHSSQAQWKFAPVQGQRHTYQIISVSNKQALEMNKIEGQNKYEVRLVRPDQQNEKQHWQIEDADNGQTLSANNQQNHG